jgi:hypothetical protein
MQLILIAVGIGWVNVSILSKALSLIASEEPCGRLACDAALDDRFKAAAGCACRTADRCRKWSLA